MTAGARCAASKTGKRRLGWQRKKIGDDEAERSWLTKWQGAAKRDANRQQIDEELAGLQDEHNTLAAQSRVHENQQTEWRERRNQAAEWAKDLPAGLTDNEIQRRAVDAWGITVAAATGARIAISIETRRLADQKQQTPERKRPGLSL